MITAEEARALIPKEILAEERKREVIEAIDRRIAALAFAGKTKFVITIEDATEAAFVKAEARSGKIAVTVDVSKRGTTLTLSW